MIYSTFFLAFNKCSIRSNSRLYCPVGLKRHVSYSIDLEKRHDTALCCSEVFPDNT